jgi:hypothetical protein
MEGSAHDAAPDRAPPVTPPGWYPDVTGALRWWDGHQWTAYVAQPPRPVRPAPVPFEPVAIEPGQLSMGLAGRLRPWLVALIGVVALALVLGGALLILFVAHDPTL